MHLFDQDVDVDLDVTAHVDVDVDDFFFSLCSCVPWCGSPFRAQGVKPNNYSTFA